MEAAQSLPRLKTICLDFSVAEAAKRKVVDDEEMLFTSSEE